MAEPTNFELLTKYFDNKFAGLEREIKRLYDQSDIKERDRDREIEKIKDEISFLKQRVEKNANGVISIEDSKKQLADIPAILARLEIIETAIQEKRKNTLTIAIAICSPIIATILTTITYFLIYKPPAVP